MATPATISRRTALSTSLMLTGMAATPALGAGEGSGPALLQAFLDTLSAHDLKAFRALYVDEGYIQHQTLVINAPASGKKVTFNSRPTS